MKKFNVKVLSMAVTAAVASGAAGAAEQNFAAAVGGKDDQGQAAFFTVFGEGTTYDKDTGKLTFKKDSDALLLKTLELEQTINGFASGSNFITTDANGNKTVREATNEDIEADSLKGVGLAGGLTAVNARVDDLLDDTAAALDEQEKAIEKLNNATKTNIDQITKITEGVNTLNTSVAEMGKDISTKFDEVDSEISKASFELSESIEKVSEDVTAVNKRVDTLEQETAAAKTSAKAAEDKVTELSANIDSKVKEAKDAAANAVDAASKIDAVADKADKASKDVEDLNKTVDGLAERAALSIAENAQQIDGFKEGDEIVVTDDKGIKSVKTATKEDVEQDEFGGLGLREVAAKHDQSLADLTAEAERAKKAAEQAAFAAIENAQELNGFKEKDEIIVTDDNGVKSVKTATKEDVESDEFKGLGLKEVVATHDEALGDLTETVNDNSEALVKTAEVVNAISADVNANKAAIETKADKADFEELAKYTADMGKKVNDIGDEVTALSDATSAAITRHDKDIVDLAQAGLTATEALEANRKDIDTNKAAIAENTAALEKQKEANEGFNNAITSLDKDIGDLALAGKAAMEALEVNRQDIDANKAAIETKADKDAVETAKNAAVKAEKSVQAVQGSVEIAQKSAQTAESHAKAAQTSAVAANNVASTAQTAAAKAQESADTNAVQIAANTKQIDTNKTDIAALQTANGQHAAGIAKNSARIDSLDKNVANLRKETRQGLAAQAALSGLFQPYSVGKFNLTAALGGFKSDTAVAVGAGYRFNENFAAKAGLAVGTSSGGSASYNVGLNYEW